MPNQHKYTSKKTINKIIMVHDRRYVDKVQWTKLYDPNWIAGIKLKWCKQKVIRTKGHGPHNRQVTFPSGVGSKLKKGFGYGYV